MLCRLCIFPMPDSVSCLMHLLLIRLQNTSKLSKWLNFEILDRHVIPCDILPKVLCLQTAKTFITRDATKVDPRSNSYSYTAGWTEHLDFGLIWKQSECQLGCKCLLAPTNNQTKKNRTTHGWPMLVLASIGCTRCATGSNAWCTLSNTSFYTFGGGNEGHFILDLTIGKPFQLSSHHEMNDFISCSYQNI